MGAALAAAVVTSLVVAGSLAISRAVAARRAADAVTSHAAPEMRRIVVSDTTLELLRREHAARTGALPTAAEEEALVRDHVDRELLFREAQALDLGRDDPIVKRRLTQKMEALLEAAAGTLEPTDAEIRDWFWAHRERYEEPARVTFTHVFFRRERIDGDLSTVAAGALAALERGDDPTSMGEPFVRGTRFQAKSRDEIAAIFGRDFAEGVVTAAEQRWVGPIPSSFGWHLVRVDEHEGVKLAEIGEVRDRIADEMRRERSARGRREALDRLREQYVVETPSVRGPPPR